jgi:enamine deaminase RidA (YjgF/YER057c/UK114 family)
VIPRGRIHVVPITATLVQIEPPTRSVIGVSALANPGFLVEIEVIAVAAKK